MNPAHPVTVHVSGSAGRKDRKRSVVTEEGKRGADRASPHQSQSESRDRSR